MFRPEHLEKAQEDEFVGLHASQVRKMTKSEKKKNKIGAINNLNPDMNFEIQDPMSGLKKAARHMRFQSDQVICSLIFGPKFLFLMVSKLS